jgi:ubiquinone/menaquinone biosynthesis C-methylase UbiE
VRIRAIFVFAAAVVAVGSSVSVLIRAGLAQSTAPAQRAGDPESQSQGRPESTATKAKAKKSRSTKGRIRRDAPGFYMGRPIAGVMTWDGADWLFRETRIEEEQPEAMLEALKIPRGAAVADVGAGPGYHSIRLARRVGAKGTVYATDVQSEMLRMLRSNARIAGVSNIKAIRCTQTDPGLPEESVDLILMVDVYHECSDPEATLQGLRSALRPGGRLVLVEFRAEDPEVPIKPEHKMTLEQVRRELEPQGFTFKESLEFLPWQHVIIFEKRADADAKTNTSPGVKEEGKAESSAAKPSARR